MPSASRAMRMRLVMSQLLSHGSAAARGSKQDQGGKAASLFSFSESFLAMVAQYMTIITHSPWQPSVRYGCMRCLAAEPEPSNVHFKYPQRGTSLDIAWPEECVAGPWRAQPARPRE